MIKKIIKEIVLFVWSIFSDRGLRKQLENKLVGLQEKEKKIQDTPPTTRKIKKVLKIGKQIGEISEILSNVLR